MPFTSGVTCDQCGSDVTGLAAGDANTGIDGKFTLTNVPAVRPFRWWFSLALASSSHAADGCLLFDDGGATTSTVCRATRQATFRRIAGCHRLGGPDGVRAAEDRHRHHRVYRSERHGPRQLHSANATISGDGPTAATLFGNLTTMKRYDPIILDCEGAPYDKSAYYNNLLNHRRGWSHLLDALRLFVPCTAKPDGNRRY